MRRTFASSQRSQRSLALVEALQKRFVQALQSASQEAGTPAEFTEVEWLRDDGRHGGGSRFQVGDNPAFNRGSVNVSQVHYDDLPEKKLSSATAISTIIHPEHPRAPSVHIHISWTEMRDGRGYWRMMADLNPSIPAEADKKRFADAIQAAAGEHFEAGSAQGDRYFFIPPLNRHRGVYHFYLEGYTTEDFDADSMFAQTIGEAAIDTYVQILSGAWSSAGPITAEDRAAQRAYHSVYLFQVLTLDRGTTSGLLVHDQNDVGIMGSLPAVVDGALIRSWLPRMTPPQDELLGALVEALGEGSECAVSLEVKRALAAAVRAHYQAHPKALSMQASGDVVPPTVANHA